MRIPALARMDKQRKRKGEPMNLTQPPADYNEFLVAATTTFLAKDTDYDSRFMRGMMDLDARTLWAWEVDKKLDRLRTWINRGELLVKGEGVENSIQDLFVYTVQYVFYIQTAINNRNPVVIKDWQEGRGELFSEQAAKLKPAEWVEFLVMKERIAPNEYALQNFLRLYMGASVHVKDWQQAIREILKD